MKLHIRRSTVLVCLIGSCIGTSQGSPTADYRFVPVQIAPLASLILYVSPSTPRTLSAAPPTPARSVPPTFIQSLRFETPVIRTELPKFPGHLPEFLPSITRPN